MYSYQRARETKIIFILSIVFQILYLIISLNNLPESILLPHVCGLVDKCVKILFFRREKSPLNYSFK